MNTLIVGSGINQVKSVKERCYAIDISQEYLDKAKKFKPNNEYILADVQKLPFKDNFFDKVIFTHVLEHVGKPTKALSEIYRVLKKGGELYLEVPTEEMELFLSKNNKVFKKYIYTKYHNTHYNEDKLRNQMKSYEIVSFKKTYGQYIVFWYLWGKFISSFNMEKRFYIEECGQIHSTKFDFLAKQFSRFLFILNIISSPFVLNKIPCEYHVVARK